MEWLAKPMSEMEKTCSLLECPWICSNLCLIDCEFCLIYVYEM
jgi:hypothetical protein